MTSKSLPRFGLFSSPLAKGVLTRSKICSQPKLCTKKWQQFQFIQKRKYARRREERQQTTGQVHEWKLGLDIQRQVDNPNEPMSLPVMIYFYSPWKYLTTKFNVFKLKLLWDPEFVEEKFISNAKEAAVIITDMVSDVNTDHLSQCTTPMGYKQISHDLLGSSQDTRLKLLRFRQEDFRRALPLKVKMLRHYGHKYAFIDMLFVGLRRTNDFPTPEEVNEINAIIQKMQYRQAKNSNHLVSLPLMYPIVFVEIFIRFRRDYSMNSTGFADTASTVEPKQWLISNYKILQFDIMNYHPYIESTPIA